MHQEVVEAGEALRPDRYDDVEEQQGEGAEEEGIGGEGLGEAAMQQGEGHALRTAPWAVEPGEGMEYAARHPRGARRIKTEIYNSKKYHPAEAE